MKKFLLVLLVVSLVAVSILAVACQKEEPVAPEAEGEYTIVSPDGAPAIALATFAKNEKVSDTLTIKPSIVASTLIKSEAIKSDFAIVPANMAAILFNAGEKYKLVSTVTNGNMFILAKEAEENFTLENMKGKMLYTIGQGSVPALILLSILQKNNIEYVVSETPVEGKVAIQYCDNGQVLMGKLKTATTQVYGNLAEPAVNTATINQVGYKVADLQQLWKEATSSEVLGYAQAVLIAKEEICNNKPEVVDAVVKAIKDSEQYVIDNAQEVAETLKTVYPETSMKQLFPIVVTNCNVKVHTAKDNFDYIKTTLDAAHAINPQSVGGSVPARDSGFYYL